MRIISREPRGYLVRLDTGEELIEALRRLAAQRKIRGAWFLALGAADRIEIAFYDMRKKKYITRKFAGRLEILHLAGNIARNGQGIAVHAHGVFGRPNYGAIGGHVVSCRISATCELYLVKLGAMKRRPDPRTGLNLLY